MTEHRRAPRRHAEEIVQVTNTVTGEFAGRIANISVDGIMLVAPHPARDNSLYQFSFQLPDAQGRRHELEIGVHEQWSEPATVPGQHWIGFRFIDIGEQDQAILDDWLERVHGH